MLDRITKLDTERAIAIKCVSLAPTSSVRVQAQAAPVNSFAFGGANVSLVVRAA